MSQDVAVGERIVTENIVLRYSESSETNIVGSFGITTDVLENGEEYCIKLINLRGPREDTEIADYTATAHIHNKKFKFNLPREVRENISAVVPGQSLRVDVYEYTAESNQTDGSNCTDEDGQGEPRNEPPEILDRTNVTTSNGSLEARMRSEAVVNHLTEQGGTARLQFSNPRTGQTATAESHCHYAGDHGRFMFPKQAREEVSARAGDTIHVYPSPDATEQLQLSDRVQFSEEKLVEMYEAVMDLHEAYLNATDD
jgi:hypothetical protein